MKLDDKSKILLEEAILLQKSLESRLFAKFSKPEAEAIYLQFQQLMTDYRSRFDMLGVFHKDTERYFRIINESIGYAIGHIQKDYHV